MRLRTVTAGPALAVFAAAALVLTAQPAAASIGVRPSGAPQPAISASLLAPPPAVDVNNVRTHLQQLQNFASSSGGNRATGTAGHTATTTYLQQKLQAAGLHRHRADLHHLQRLGEEHHR